MKKHACANTWKATCLVLLLILLAACNKYIVYKTVTRNPEKTKRKLINYIQHHKDFVLSVHGTEYKLDSVVIDEQTGRARGRAVPVEVAAGPYRPEDPRLKDTRYPRGKINKEMGEGRIFNQVFLVADTMFQNHDAMEIPLASIRRIDVVQRNDGLLIGLIVLGIVIGGLIIALLTADDWACFIATACYGDYNAPEVRVFRRYRDEVLRKTAAGQIFVRLYYVLSPPMARLLSRWEWGRRQVRLCILEPLAKQIATKQRCQDFAAGQEAGRSQGIA